VSASVDGRWCLRSSVLWPGVLVALRGGALALAGGQRLWQWSQATGHVLAEPGRSRLLASGAGAAAVGLLCLLGGLAVAGGLRWARGFARAALLLLAGQQVLMWVMTLATQLPAAHGSPLQVAVSEAVLLMESCATAGEVLFALALWWLLGSAEVRAAGDGTAEAVVRPGLGGWLACTLLLFATWEGPALWPLLHRLREVFGHSGLAALVVAQALLALLALGGMLLTPLAARWCRGRLRLLVASALTLASVGELAGLLLLRWQAGGLPPVDVVAPRCATMLEAAVLAAMWYHAKLQFASNAPAPGENESGDEGLDARDSRLGQIPETDRP
jgi:hypothetical protein